MSAKRQVVCAVVVCAVAAAIGCSPVATRQAEVNKSLVELEARKQREIAFERLVEQAGLVTRVYHQLEKAAVGLCPKGAVEYDSGFDFSTKYDWGDDWLEFAMERLGVGDVLRVEVVVPGSPADVAGIQMGDAFVSVNGKPLKTGKRATKYAQKLLDRAEEAGKSIEIGLVRDEQQMTVQVIPEEVCLYPVAMYESDEVNAMADGKGAYISTGLLRFIEKEQEVALILAHELAHNIMEHPHGSMNTSRIQARESEADYVGLYLMARAGMSIDGAAVFWRRMGTSHTADIASGRKRTHPPSPERFVAIEAAVSEIKAKQAAGMPLEPELRESLWKRLTN